MKQRILALAVCVTCAIGVGALADTDEGAGVIREHLHPFANQSGAAAVSTTAQIRPQPTCRRRLQSSRPTACC